MRARGAGRNPCSGCDPSVVGFERHPKLVVEDSQVAVATTYDRIRPDRLHFLRHHADIGLVAAVVAEAIEAEAIVEMTKQCDVVFQRDIRASSATTTASAAATATAEAATTTAHAHAATTATAHAHAATATSTETGVTA